MKIRPHSLSPSIARGIAVMCAAVSVASAHTAQAGINVWTSHGPGSRYVGALAIDPITPRTLYAGTYDAGVFDIEQVPPPCVGDCSGTSSVAINDLIMLLNIALGDAQPSACPHGVPSGTDATVTVIIQAVNNALDGCGSGQ